MDVPTGNDPRVLLAAERTFLAWIRTGVALMGFGFVVARFGIFLRELRLADPAHEAEGSLSVPIGIVLVALGVLTTAAAAYRHRRDVEAIREGVFAERFRSRFPTLVALLLALLGVAMAAYLARL